MVEADVFKMLVDGEDFLALEARAPGPPRMSDEEANRVLTILLGVPWPPRPPEDDADGE